MVGFPLLDVPIRSPSRKARQWPVGVTTVGKAKAVEMRSVNQSGRDEGQRVGTGPSQQPRPSQGGLGQRGDGATGSRVFPRSPFSGLAFLITALMRT